MPRSFSSFAKDRRICRWTGQSTNPVTSLCSFTARSFSVRQALQIVSCAKSFVSCLLKKSTSSCLTRFTSPPTKNLCRTGWQVAPAAPSCGLGVSVRIRTRVARVRSTHHRLATSHAVSVPTRMLHKSRGGEIRTRGLLVPNQALHQVELHPVTVFLYALLTGMRQVWFDEIDSEIPRHLSTAESEGVCPSA